MPDSFGPSLGWTWTPEDAYVPVHGPAPYVRTRAEQIALENFRVLRAWVRARHDVGSIEPSEVREDYEFLEIQACNSYRCNRLVRRADTRRCNAGLITRACTNCNCCSDHCECSHCSAGDHSFSTADYGYCSGCESCSDCRAQTCNNCSSCQSCCECETEDDDSDCPVEKFTQKPTFHSAARHQRKFNPSARFVAAEIEVASVSEDDGVSRTVRKWGGSIVEDGSLPDSGFEVNTSPAAGDVFVRQVKEICSALSDSSAKVTADCGLHVHVDARDLDYYAIRRLIKIYAKIETLLYSMVSASRKTSSYCLPCGPKFLAAIGQIETNKRERRKIAYSLYGTTDTKDDRKEKYNRARYTALNLHSWLYRGTIECRVFNGTTDPDKIAAWGMLWAQLLDHAAKTTEKEIDALIASGNPYRVLRQIVTVESVRQFIDARIEQHGDDRAKKEMRGEAEPVPIVVEPAPAPAPAPAPVPVPLLSAREYARTNYLCACEACVGRAARIIALGAR